MTDPFSREPGAEKLEDQAAGWILRLDRGLSPEEQDAFFDWLSADPRHAGLLARHRNNWKRLDKLADWRPEHARRPNPDLLAPPPKPAWSRRSVWVTLAAAAAVTMAIGWWSIAPSTRPESATTVAALRPENRRILTDGSSVKLNDDAAVTVLFSSSERRIRLDRGEGFFLVTKDPARPFIVEAHGVEVRAVGTAFNVSVGSKAVSVLVAEGVVRVDAPSVSPDVRDEAAVAASTVLAASQQADISLSSQVKSPVVTTVTRHEMHRALAWQHGMMTFDKRPLSAIVAELNLLNDRQLVIGDAAVAAMQFSGTIRSDNVEGFVRLLEAGFGVRGEDAGPAGIILHRL